MLCSDCKYKIVQKFDLGDLNGKGEHIPREILSCELLCKPMSKLISCSMFENKNEEKGDDDGFEGTEKTY